LPSRYGWRLEGNVVVRSSLRQRWWALGGLSLIGSVIMLVGLFWARLSPAITLLIFGAWLLLYTVVAGIGIVIAVLMEDGERLR